MKTAKKTSLSPRQHQLNHRIRDELSLLLRKEVKDPRLLWVQINEVQLSPNCSSARVYFSVLQGDVPVAGKALKQAASFLRSSLFKRLSLPNSPLLYFVFDDTTEKAVHLHSLIHQALTGSAENL